MPTKDNHKITQRTINALETKNAIFNAAVKLFGERGYDNVTVEEITDSIGMSKGTFYTHFESKDSIMIEQFRRIDEHYINTQSMLPKDATASLRLRTLMLSCMDYAENTCGIHVFKVIYASQLSSRVKVLSDKKRPFYSLIRQFVQQGRKNGEFRLDIEEDDMVTIAARGLRALLYDWCLFDEAGEFDLSIEKEKHINFLIASLQKPSAAER